MGNEQLTLKPCPFCGGKAKMHTGRAAEDAEYAQVTCGGCSTSTDFFEDAYAPTDDAAYAWNRRAVNSHEALVKALKGLVDCHAKFTGEPGHDAAVWAEADDAARAALKSAES